MAVKLRDELKLRQLLIQRIQDKARELKRVPRQRDLLSPNRYYAAFGSFNNALHAAGYRSSRNPKHRLIPRYLQGQQYIVTKAECLDALKRLSVKLGARPTSSDIQSDAGAQAGCPSFKVILQRFGSLSNALKRAGINDLKTRFEIKKEVKNAEIDALLSRPFVMPSDMPADPVKLRRLAKKKGIPVLRESKNQYFRIVLGWMRGESFEGIKLDHESIKLGMGRAYEILCLYCRGMSFAEIGNDAGLSRERIRQIIYKKSADLVRKTLSQ